MRPRFGQLHQGAELSTEVEHAHEDDCVSDAMASECYKDPTRKSIEMLYAEACRKIDRLSPEQALAELKQGAVMIDVRTPDNRELFGIVPGTFHIPRTVLEWCVDIDSPWRNPHLGGDLDTRIIILCDHGFSSVFAATTLRELGFSKATDVQGGFEAWLDAGLPSTTAPKWPPPSEGEGGWGKIWGPDWYFEGSFENHASESTILMDSLKSNS
jgi:rhodanese-related sulfurtransferase